MKNRILSLLLSTALALPAAAAPPPQLQNHTGGTQLLVDKRAFPILGGELGNSSASHLEYMESVWPKLKAMHLHTLLVPVYWELLEAEEGNFDFSLIEALLDRARRENLRLVLLWFGSWKNSMSTYAPSWVKRDTARFPRALDEKGIPQEILTPFSENNLNADRRAFAALMRFLKRADGKYKTVIMVQVENEIGMLPSPRDHHPLADAAFASQVPEPLLDYLREHKAQLEPELRAAWRRNGFRNSGSWAQLFGGDTTGEEIFTAWYFARYTNAVAAAGKAEYPLPMFVNAALNRPGASPGEYPSGGPLPHLMDIWKAAAPNIDLMAPDFYNPHFQYWNDRYTRQGDPLLIPEIRFDTDAGAKALYAFGHYNTLGFSPFSIETGSTKAMENLARSYDLLAQLGGHITAGSIKEGVWLTRENPQMAFTLGDYHFTAKHEFTLGWSPGSEAETWPEAGALIVQTGLEDFMVAGTGVVLTFAADGKRAGIDTLEEGEFQDGKWTPGRRLNGDQSHQGRHLRIPGGEWQIQKLRLYRY
ncbi:GH35 family beta-galactosidase [Microbulbifer thermotolerans]|uniref:GH35 family beta-galactosidase n=1 Tax=Microbulbifer thermotolerans TaxID=252514 RepID=UPI0009ED487F|nr:DUF5597 domain-containing protein [Microbulbifer thermotolerans]